MTERVDGAPTMASQLRMKRAKKAAPTNLEGVLDEIAEKCANDETPEKLTLGEILDSVGRRSYGPLLLVIGLFTISPATVVPGMTWFAAVLTLIVCGTKGVSPARKNPPPKIFWIVDSATR